MTEPTHQMKAMANFLLGVGTCCLAVAYYGFPGASGFMRQVQSAVATLSVGFAYWGFCHPLQSLKAFRRAVASSSILMGQFCFSMSYTPLDCLSIFIIDLVSIEVASRMSGATWALRTRLLTYRLFSACGGYGLATLQAGSSSASSARPCDSFLCQYYIITFFCFALSFWCFRVQVMERCRHLFVSQLPFSHRRSNAATQMLISNDSIVVGVIPEATRQLQSGHEAEDFGQFLDVTSSHPGHSAGSQNEHQQSSAAQCHGSEGQTDDLGNPGLDQPPRHHDNSDPEHSDNIHVDAGEVLAELSEHRQEYGALLWSFLAPIPSDAATQDTLATILTQPIAAQICSFGDRSDSVLAVCARSLSSGTRCTRLRRGFRTRFFQSYRRRTTCEHTACS
eukprot:TRINITY_DN25951_c0_g1_i1.p1 TRINITY_DN25951_c0_g1~~TRINITY_DN25951_c0_g1_i1.p1  ORF type:complete len:393 (-),score=10.90 TRINITY_DN25951_c0_g1_i1:201-1379(-)